MNPCSRKPGCQAKGLCKLNSENGKAECVAAPVTDCKTARVCSEDGRCSAVEGRCVALNDSQCRGSMRCGMFGECRAFEGTCVKDCYWSAPGIDDTSLCGVQGLCEASGGVCVASQASCRKSELCSTAGRCTAIEGKCVATSDKECSESQNCRFHGACSVDGPERRCVYKHPRVCESTCAEYGHCTLRDGQCIAAETAERVVCVRQKVPVRRG